MPSTDPKSLWYRDGLRFECTQCGKCCTGAPGYVWVDDDEVEALSIRARNERKRFPRELTLDVKAIAER